MYETTGYDARNATYKNGTFIAEDGTDLLALFKEKAKNGAGYELYSNRWLEYAKNGWMKQRKMNLLQSRTRRMHRIKLIRQNPM